MKPLQQGSNPEERKTADRSLLAHTDPADLAPHRDRRAVPFPAPDLCLIRLREVLEICGKSRSSVYESIKRGEFPAPVKLCGRSSAWVKSEVIQWAEACIRASRS